MRLHDSGGNTAVYYFFLVQGHATYEWWWIWIPLDNVFCLLRLAFLFQCVRVCYMLRFVSCIMSYVGIRLVLPRDINSAQGGVRDLSFINFAYTIRVDLLGVSRARVGPLALRASNMYLEHISKRPAYKSPSLRERCFECRKFVLHVESVELTAFE